MDVELTKSKIASLLKKWSETLILFAGVAGMLLGFIVLAGWYAHIPALIQIRPQFAPMQYNAALGILLAGASLCSFTLRWKWLMQVLGGFVAILGVLTLVEYLFNISLGVDQLWFRHYITTFTSAAGRMSPVSAICFGLMGAALLIAGNSKATQWRSLVVGALASVVVSLGAMAILGYIFGLPETYGWGRLSRMALHTACGIGMVSLGIFVIAWNDGRSGDQLSPRWLPVPIALGGVTASLILWLALEAKQVQATAHISEVNAANVKSQIETQLESHIKGLKRMAQRWEFAGRPTQAAWEADAKNYFDDFQDFQAIEWVDSSYHIRWIVPLAGNEQVVNRDLTQEARRQAAVKMARQEHQPAITRPIQLAQGGIGFIIYTPIGVGTDFDGFVVGVFRADRFFGKVLFNEVARGNSITISEAGNKIYERNISPLPANQDWIQDFTVNKLGTTWNVSVWPTPELTSQLHTQLPNTVLGVGLIVSGLLTLVARLLQKNQREIIARQQAAAKLQHTLSLQNAILSSTNYAIISTTTEGVATTFNAAAERWLGYLSSEIVGKKTPALWHDQNEVIARAKALSDELGTVVNPGFESFVAKARLGGVDENEWTFIRKNGERFPVSLSVTALTDDAGRVTGFLGVIADITERKQAKEKLHVSEERFRQAFEGAPIGMALVSPDGQFLKVNQTVAKMLGYSEAELLAREFQHITHPDDLSKDLAFVQRMLKGEILSYQMEKRYLHSRGDIIYAMLSVSLMRNREGEPIYFISQIENITDRKQAEQNIIESLREKEALLREIHHRVKNNMQVISSLLRLQANYIKDAAALEIFKDCQNRIRTMALVHEKLYRSEGLAQVDCKDYLESLVSLVISSQSAKGVLVRQQSQIERLMLDVDTAIPLGLIVNELVSNSLKHAFIGQAQGRVLVSLHKSEGDRLQLVVQDDGKGLPAGFTAEKADSLGLRLVKILASQIKGDVVFENDSGTKITVTFDYSGS